MQEQLRSEETQLKLWEFDCSFVQHTNRMIADGYLPTEADVLYSYAPTIGLDGHAIRLGKIRYE